MALRTAAHKRIPSPHRDNIFLPFTTNNTVTDKCTIIIESDIREEGQYYQDIMTRQISMARARRYRSHQSYTHVLVERTLIHTIRTRF